MILISCRCVYILLFQRNKLINFWTTLEKITRKVCLWTKLLVRVKFPLKFLIRLKEKNSIKCLKINFWGRANNLKVRGIDYFHLMRISSILLSNSPTLNYINKITWFSFLTVWVICRCANMESLSKIKSLKIKMLFLHLEST